MPETMGSAAAKVLRSFCVLSGALSFCQRLGSGPLRTRASPWDLSGTWIFAGPRRKPRDAAKIAALLTYRGMGCNIAKPRQNRGFARLAMAPGIMRLGPPRADGSRRGKY